MTSDLDGWGVAITGGAQGLGYACAEAFARRGAGVALIDLNSEALDRAAARLAEETGAPVHAVPGSVARRAEAEAALAQAHAALGRLDSLINNAGVYPRKALYEIEDADWDASVGVNLRGVYNMTAAAAPILCANAPRAAASSGRPVRGRIVAVSSVDAFKAHPANAHYAAVKAAVLSLTKSFALDLAPKGVLVNAVAPAAMATEKAQGGGFLEEFAALTPIGRAADPAEVAAAILHLAGPENSYIAGETLLVAGGYVMD